MSSDFSEDYLPLLGLLNLLNWQRFSYLRGVLSTIRGFVRAPWCSCALVWPDLRGPSIETGSAWNASSLASHPRLLGQLSQETKLHFEHAFQIEFVLKLDFWNPLFVFFFYFLPWIATLRTSNYEQIHHKIMRSINCNFHSFIYIFVTFHECR